MGTRIKKWAQGRGRRRARKGKEGHRRKDRIAVSHGEAGLGRAKVNLIKNGEEEEGNGGFRGGGWWVWGGGL